MLETTDCRFNPDTKLREVAVIAADGTKTYRELQPHEDGYVSIRPPRRPFAQLSNYLCSKPAHQITEAEALEAVADIAKDPRVRHVAISQFHPIQQRWLLDVDLTDGINGDLKGEHSIGRIYGDLRSTTEGWVKILAEKKAEEERRAAQVIAYYDRLDDAAMEAIQMLAAKGFSVDDVVAGMNRIMGGRYMDAEWRMSRALEFHSDVICPKFAHLDGAAPVQCGNVDFYHGSRGRGSRPDMPEKLKSASFDSLNREWHPRIRNAQH